MAELVECQPFDLAAKVRFVMDVLVFVLDFLKVYFSTALDMTMRVKHKTNSQFCPPLSDQAWNRLEQKCQWTFISQRIPPLKAFSPSFLFTFT